SSLCVNDDEVRREADDQIDNPDPTGSTVYCRTPKAPDNGSLRVNKRRYEVAEMLEVTCFSGFELTGYQFYRCLPDGSWHKEDVECQLRVCNRPATSPPATLHPFKTQYSIGEFIHVKCPARMAPAGQDKYTCGSSLNWEPDPPQEIRCQS
ncbi:hypothetical protein scyTo_0022144, partial [Scyliorhinus torazame]|nr:hypothetical protein [Scyliorhinus torazame]